MEQNQINKCYNELYKKRPILLFLLSNRKKIRALKDISIYGNIADIKYIYPFVFKFPKSLSIEAVKTINTLISQVKPKEWTGLYDSFKYIDIHPRQVKILSLYFFVDRVHLLGIASLNENGHVRQAALHQLSKLNDGRGLPYVILRLSDWVQQVRIEAEKALEGFFRPEFISEFLKCHYLFRWMERVERVDLNAIKNKILDFLVRNKSYLDFKEEIKTGDSIKRRVCYQILERCNTYGELAVFVKADSDPAVRLWFIQRLCESDYGDKETVKIRFLDDVNSKVVTNIIAHIDDSNWHLYEEKVREKLYDTSVSVRDASRYILKKHGFTSYSVYLRKKIEECSAVKPGHIYGLSETGDHGDFSFIFGFRTHPQARLRLAALVGIYNLDKLRSLPYLVESIDDQSGKIRKKCQELLRKNFDSGIVELIRLNLHQFSPSGKISALSLLCSTCSWDSLFDLFPFLFVEGQSEVKKRAWAEFKRWYNVRSYRLWVKPLGEQIKVIENTISTVHNVPEDNQELWKNFISLIQDGKKIWT